MLVQKRREQLKAYEKQEKRIKEMKSSGATKKQAVSVITFRPGLVVTIFHMLVTQKVLL